MKTLSAPVLAALASPSVPLVQLVLLDFSSGAVALNTSNWNLTWGGIQYLGAAGMGTISAIDDSPGEIKGLQFEMSGVSSSAISMALDGSDQWQGTPVSIYTAIIDPSTYQILDAELEWSGLGDTMTIREDGETCAITATAESSAVDLLRGTPMTYTQADQALVDSSDTAFQYVNSQADQPVIWPDKSFFQK